MILPVLAGSYVVFGFCSLWITDLLLFFPLLLYQTLSARLFPLAVVELPFWGLLAFQFPQVSGNSLSRRNLWFYPGVFSLVSYQAI